MLSPCVVRMSFLLVQVVDVGSLILDVEMMVLLQDHHHLGSYRSQKLDWNG